MKKTLLSLLVVASALFLTRCSELNVKPSDSIKKPSLGSGTVAFDPVLSSVDGSCGNGQTCPLSAGQTIDAGSITVSNDHENLFVTLNAKAGSCFNKIHLWVGTNIGSVPGGNNPTPGQFPHKFEAASTEHTFTIPLSDLPDLNGLCGEGSLPVYVFAHADWDADCNGSADETAWGGCIQKDENEQGRWYFYSTFQVQCCEEDPDCAETGTCPEGHTETAFAKGGYVFTSEAKSNPDGLIRLNLTKNRWGWAIKQGTSEETYDIWAGAGLNNTANGVLVGTLTVTYDGAYVTVTYTLTGDYTMGAVHVYASDSAPSTIAPGQYGHIEYFDPKVSSWSDTYAVEDVAGDGIWIIAHAEVFIP